MFHLFPERNLFFKHKRLDMMPRDVYDAPRGIAFNWLNYGSFSD